jgi:hypothetical protein
LTPNPHDVEADLKTLGGFTGTDADGARFMAASAILFDADELETLRRWRTAYLGRYMHQQITTLADVPTTELWELVREVTELIKSETMTVSTED